MSQYLLRSIPFKGLRYSLLRSFQNFEPVPTKWCCFSSKPSRVSTQQRNHFWVSGLFGKQTQVTLKYMDKVPNEIEMIYRNDDLDVHLKWIYFVACGMAGVLIALTVLKFDVENQELLLDDENTEHHLNFELLFVLFFFCLCFMALHGCIKRMPVRIYKVPKTDEYYFIFNGSIPFTTRKLPFKRGECVKINPDDYPKILPTGSTYRLKDVQHVFIFEDGFKKPADLYVMLGQQEEYDDER